VQFVCLAARHVSMFDKHLEHIRTQNQFVLSLDSIYNMCWKRLKFSSFLQDRIKLMSSIFL